MGLENDNEQKEKEPNNMHCDGCGSDKAIALRRSETTGFSCDQCSQINVNSTSQPDVYLGKGGGLQTCEHLCDPKTGIPIPYSSKKEKKAIMDRLHLVQHPSAERQHGYRNEKHLRKTTYG